MSAAPAALAIPLLLFLAGTANAVGDPTNRLSNDDEGGFVNYNQTRESGTAGPLRCWENCIYDVPLDRNFSAGADYDANFGNQMSFTIDDPENTDYCGYTGSGFGNFTGGLRIANVDRFNLSGDSIFGTDWMVDFTVLANTTHPDKLCIALITIDTLSQVVNIYSRAGFTSGEHLHVEGTRDDDAFQAAEMAFLYHDPAGSSGGQLDISLHEWGFYSGTPPQPPAPGSSLPIEVAIAAAAGVAIVLANAPGILDNLRKKQ